MRSLFDARVDDLGSLDASQEWVAGGAAFVSNVVSVGSLFACLSAYLETGRQVASRVEMGDQTMFK